jgi:2-phospho-L-lactate guanylyltransferase
MNVFAIVFTEESGRAKKEFSAGFSPEERNLMSAAMTEDVLTALKASVIREVVVVGTEANAGQVAGKCGVSFISQGEGGLAPAVLKAIDWCLERKAEAMLVLSANIPLASSSDLDRIVELGSEAPSVVLSPSMKGGANAVFLNPPNLIKTQFGPNCFFKLVEEAINKDVALRFYSSRETALDINSEDDLCKLLEIENNTVSKRVFEQIRLKRRMKS